MRMPFWGVIGLSIGLSAVCRAQLTPTVSFQSKPIRFAPVEQPYYSGRTPMVPLKATCAKLGATVKWTKAGDGWIAARDRDRIEYVNGNPWYLFNGARLKLDVAPEIHAKVVFVPLAMLQTISGGALELAPAQGEGRSIEIYFHDRLLRFRPSEAPFWVGGAEYVAVGPMAGYLGAKLHRSRDGLHLAFTRSRDAVSYDLGQRTFLFNGARRNLRAESVVRGKTTFVPIELFQAFVGDELRGR